MTHKIKAKATPNTTSAKTFDIELTDLGVSKETWDMLTIQHKENLIQIYLDDEPEQPYWELVQWEDI